MAARGRHLGWGVTRTTGLFSATFLGPATLPTKPQVLCQGCYHEKRLTQHLKSKAARHVFKFDNEPKYARIVLPIEDHDDACLVPLARATEGDDGG